MRKFILLVILFLVFLAKIIFPVNVKAAIESCIATATPTDNQPNVQSPYIFTVTNGDPSANVLWIRLYKPHNETTLQGYSIYPSWYVDVANDSYTFRYASTSLAPGASISPTITLSIGDIEGASSDWVVQVSDDSGGANPVSCTGSLIFTVTGQNDVTAPTITNVTASSITTGSATITWTTNESASSVVQYDVNAEEQIYPFSASGSQMVTSHSLTITQSLAAGTPYYYRVCSTDGSGNQGCSSEYTFSTSATGATAAPTSATATSTPTPTTTTTTSTPTPTPIPVDRTAPRVSLTTDIESSYTEPPVIEGTATDNEEVASVSYSTDGGENWLPADNTENLGTDEVTFDFLPYVFEDGNYEVIVRALDERGNTGKSETIILVIDRLPPRVGGNLISVGPQPLIPNEEGVIITMTGIDHKVTLSTVGGPSEVTLYAGDLTFPLDQSVDTGLWSGFINFPEVGLYDLSAKAVDGAGNITTKTLNKILVVGPGEISDKESGKSISKGKVTVYVQDPLTKIWNVWDGKTFGQDNPQDIKDGVYQYLLPPGTYYLTVKASGYDILTSQIFSLERSTVLNSDFELSKASGLNFGFFRFGFVKYLTEKALIRIKQAEIGNISNPLMGKILDNFNLPTINDKVFDIRDLRGDNAVISFIGSWNPLAIEQVSVLDRLLKDRTIKGAVIASQETLSRVLIFSRRGQYEYDIVVDADGELMEELNINSLPTHLFLDRRGSVVKVVTGVLNEEEIKGIMEEI